jgi:DNA primase catalytic core
VANAEPATRSNDVVERLHDQLQESLRELVTSEDWQRALTVAARFHDYSFANTRLIWAQSLVRGFTPSRVAGYRAWQQLGRQVKRGERGLQILAPVIRKIALEEGDEEERRVVGYRVVHVFDIAQTDGEPLPEVRTSSVEGELPTHWPQVAQLIGDAGFRLQVADLDLLGEANGLTDWRRRDVVVRFSLPGAQRFKTAVHELAHVRLHEPDSGDRPACRGVVEVEAESVAYMVCAALGIDSAGYSLPYVASWSGGDLTKVTVTANRVIGCARTVLTQLEQARKLEHDQTPDRPSVHGSHRSNGEETVRADLVEIVESAADFYRRQLETEPGTKALDILRSRGVDEEAIARWGLGYAPDSWRALTEYLRGQGASDELLIESGVVGRARTGRLYDRMRNRMVFPVVDRSGRPRSIAGRLIEGDGPKYLNTPETELYRKRSLLYGLDLAEEPIRDAGRAIVVEGYLDVIACHQAGFTNTVATAGTALTPEHLGLLGEITPAVTLAFDGDRGGRLAVSQAADHTSAHPLRLHVAHLPEGEDPADLLCKHPGIFKDALAEAVPLQHHLIIEAVRQHNLDEPEGVARAVHYAGQIVAGIQDLDDRDRAVELVAALVDRSESTIRRYVGNQAPPRIVHGRTPEGLSLH